MSILHKWAITAMLAAIPSTSIAESFLTFDASIRPISLRVCWTLDAAVGQARLARRHAEMQGSYKFVARFEHAHCEWSNISVCADAIEQRIQPFLGWAIAYEPTSTKTITTLLNRDRVQIPTKMVKDTLIYYRGRVSFRGEIRPAWFELPREPYVLKYIAMKGALRR